MILLGVVHLLVMMRHMVVADGGGVLAARAPARVVVSLPGMV